MAAGTLLAYREEDEWWCKAILRGPQMGSIGSPGLETGCKLCAFACFVLEKCTCPEIGMTAGETFKEIGMTKGAYCGILSSMATFIEALEIRRALDTHKPIVQEQVRQKAFTFLNAYYKVWLLDVMQLAAGSPETVDFRRRFARLILAQQDESDPILAIGEERAKIRTQLAKMPAHLPGVAVSA
mmetsp:Transcript_21955/g.70943  ORF Transcript_21955/g.70943 Transcript_21955/m.70943 type:complete len:184 (-) Transcript_21955:5534-6085(-)